MLITHVNVWFLRKLKIECRVGLNNASGVYFFLFMKNTEERVLFYDSCVGKLSFGVLVSSLPHCIYSQIPFMETVSCKHTTRNHFSTAKHGNYEHFSCSLAYDFTFVNSFRESLFWSSSFAWIGVI